MSKRIVLVADIWGKKTLRATCLAQFTAKIGRTTEKFYVTRLHPFEPAVTHAASGARFQSVIPFVEDAEPAFYRAEGIRIVERTIKMVGVAAVRRAFKKATQKANQKVKP